MNKRTARILLKVSYVVSGLLLVVSMLDVLVWRGRYAIATYLATLLLVVLLVIILLTPDRESHRLVQVPDHIDQRVIVRWRTQP